MGCAGQLVSLWITLFSIFQVHAPWAASQTLQHIHWAGGYGQVYMDGLRDVISEFERSNPGVSIEVIVPAGNVAEYLAVQIAAGVSWDTATLMPHQGLGLALTGAFADLRPFIERDGIINLESFLPGTIDGYIYDDVIWGIPQSNIIQAFGYNHTLFQEAGLPSPHHYLAEGNWTWQTVTKPGRQLTRDTDGDGVTDMWGYELGGVPVLYNFNPILDQAGAEIFVPRVNPRFVTFTSPDVRLAAEYYLSNWIEGISPLGAANVAYLEGRAAMINYTGVGYDKAPESAEHRIIPHPKGPVRGGASVTAWGLQISATTRHPDLAWEWVKFLALSETSLNMLFRTRGILPPTKDALHDWLEVTNAPERQKLEMIEVAIDPDNRPRRIDPSADRISTMLSEEFQKVIRGEITLDHALANIQVQATAELERLASSR